MGEIKRRKSLSSSPKKPKEKLPKFDKPFNIGELLYTPLGQVCDSLIKDVEVPFPDPIEPKHKIIFQEYQSQLKIELLWVLKEWYRVWERTEYPFNTAEARALEPTFRTLNCHIVRIAIACLTGKATYSKNSSTLKRLGEN